MQSTSWLNIDLDALEANVRSIRRWAGPAVALCAVVKADAYGLGSVPVSRKLVEAGVDMLAVYNLQQARQLADAGVSADLLVLMPTDDLEPAGPLYRLAVNRRLHFTCHGPDHARQLERIGSRLGAVLPVHLEIDTGMSRGGMSTQQAGDLLLGLSRFRWLKLAGIFTHPASADSDPAMTEQQMARLDELLDNCRRYIGSDVLVHFANTHAMLRDRRYHRRMLRIGLSLWGLGAGDLTDCPGPLPDLHPVVSWHSRIVLLRQIPAGTSVGYNATFTTWRPSRLAIAPVGYGDGYPVALSNRAVVRVGPEYQPAPVRGKVSMDQLIVDVTDIDPVQIGSEVEIYSNQPGAPNAIDQLARLARTHCYEILCRLSPHIERRYVTGS